MTSVVSGVGDICENNLTMRKINLVVFSLLSIVTIHAQSSKSEKDTLFINEIYQADSILLVSQKVLEFDSISANELLIRFENWAGQNFRNYEKVRTSKTDSQITLNYITSSFNSTLDFHVILIAEFKNNKIRVQIFDDGNVYKPGYYSGNTYISGIQGRLLHINHYFTDGMIIYKPKPGIFNVNEKNATGSLSYKTSMNNTIEEIYSFIKLNNSNQKIEKNNEGW